VLLHVGPSGAQGPGLTQGDLDAAAAFVRGFPVSPV